uniref:Uncharacterized protein n=1 Tax=Panagrolaimus sp. JU765 TaxID=591449 RepID=A0AC34PYL9_9BILA
MSENSTTESVIPQLFISNPSLFLQNQNFRNIDELMLAAATQNHSQFLNSTMDCKSPPKATSPYSIDTLLQTTQQNAANILACAAVVSKNQSQTSSINGSPPPPPMNSGDDEGNGI